MKNNKDEQMIEEQVKALAESLAMRDLRYETKGQCDTVEPDSIEGQQCSRLAHIQCNHYTELLQNTIEGWAKVTQQ